MLAWLLPSNLFARALLILVLPMLLSQLFIAYIFYDRHWSSVERNMASSVVGDLAWIHATYSEERGAHGALIALQKAQTIGRQLNITVSTENISPKSILRGRSKKQFPELYKGLVERLGKPISIRADEANKRVIIDAVAAGDVLRFSIHPKSVSSQTTTLFMLWMSGSSLLLTMIAILFLRNQVQPIVRLAAVAEQLGLGQDVTDFKPRGASEVRRAGRAFLLMAERISRHVQNRTEMLAGISHDLRTPLTRMKLELELASDITEPTREALTADIEDMRQMIDEYLDFARGDAGELAEPMDVAVLLAHIVAGYQRSKANVSLVAAPSITLMLRPQAVRRAIHNLIDNALRYGGGVAMVTLEHSLTFVRIKITDHGPGIDPKEQETVFKPFTRLEPSRNTQTGGVGLGLSIARAIAQSHGGDITLENCLSDDGRVIGLEATLRLPRPVQPVA